MAALRGTRMESRLLGPVANRPGPYYVRYWLSRLITFGVPFLVSAEIISRFHPTDFVFLIGFPLALATVDTHGRGRRLRPMFLAPAARA